MAEKEVDYAALYQRMVRATESAIRILIQAQQECEQAYIDAGAAEDGGRLIKLEKKHE